MNIHPNTISILNKLTLSTNLPAVMIFHGPKVKEKKQLALDLINKILNPSQEPIFAGRIKNEKHPDVQVYSATNQDQYSLSTVKGWVEEANLPPLEVDSKWIIIDDVEKLTTIHYNTLLKTLEEPVLGLHFVLLAESLDQILDTVLSRAIKIPFFSLSKISLKSLLTSSVELEDDLLVSLLQGSLDRVEFIQILLESHFFEYVQKALLACNRKNLIEFAALLDQIEKAVSIEALENKTEDIFESFYVYTLCLVKKMGLKDPSWFRKIINIQTTYDVLRIALKRHIKLRSCLERFIFSNF